MKWLYWNRVLCDKLEDPNDPDGSGAGESGEEGSSPNGNQNSEDPPTGSEGFTHPALVGKTEEEIAEILAVQNRTIASQRTSLDDYNARIQRLENQPQGGGDPNPEPQGGDPQDFFTNPHQAVRDIVKQTVGNEVREAVAPLMSDMAVRQRDMAWETVRRKYPKMAQYEDAVREKIRSWQIDVGSANATVIESALHAVVGEMALGGDFNVTSMNDGGGAPSGGGGNDNRPGNPQHRPGNQPLTTEQTGAPKPRELSEDEKAYARRMFADAEDPYAAYRAMTDDEANVNADGAFVLEG